MIRRAIMLSLITLYLSSQLLAPLRRAGHQDLRDARACYSRLSTMLHAAVAYAPQIHECAESIGAGIVHLGSRIRAVAHSEHLSMP